MLYQFRLKVQLDFWIKTGDYASCQDCLEGSCTDYQIGNLMRLKGCFNTPTEEWSNL